MNSSSPLLSRGFKFSTTTDELKYTHKKVSLVMLESQSNKNTFYPLLPANVFVGMLMIGLEFRVISLLTLFSS
jgi:hypothetical protein